MSHLATNWAVSQRGISPAAKVLLWQLADRHNPDNGCFPDQDTLARDCEMARSTINEQLKKLEQAGLVKRVTKRHPVTKRQLPTRYYLAFEREFAAIVAPEATDEEPEQDDESRVRIPDTDPEASRVRNSGEAVSDLQAEPSPADRTHNQGLTSKVTSNSTGKRAGRADRETVFKDIWKVFPMRPGSPEMQAWEVFEKLDDADVNAALKGAQRYAAWFREKVASEGKPLEDQLRFVKYLSRWLHERGWIDAAKLPVKALPGAEAAKALEGIEYVHKPTQWTLFAECERVLGRAVPVGGSGKWGFPKEVVEQARERLHQGTGPPH
jgi:DNA-binding MarR family transcriptional regulator